MAITYIGIVPGKVVQRVEILLPNKKESAFREMSFWEAMNLMMGYAFSDKKGNTFVLIKKNKSVEVGIIADMCVFYGIHYIVSTEYPTTSMRKILKIF